MTVKISKNTPDLRGEIQLPASKSLSNRAAICLALAGAKPADWLENPSTARDTQTLLQLLENQGNTFDAGDAGTTFRFLTAYLATRPGTQILTGSPRMKQRPIAPLVDALRQLGADVQYVENEGFAPLAVGELQQLSISNHLPIAIGTEIPRIKVLANISSQFLSALLMLGPTLPNGLELLPEGTLVSEPYLEMTRQIMAHFGAKTERTASKITVPPSQYFPKKFKVEADWSAASYWFSMAALAPGEVDLWLPNLWPDSQQGDSVLPEIFERFGVAARFETGGLRLQKSNQVVENQVLELGFSRCPDLAQTVAVVCAAKGQRAIFSGLQTLKIKETDRVAALQNELRKIICEFSPSTSDAGSWTLAREGALAREGLRPETHRPQVSDLHAAPDVFAGQRPADGGFGSETLTSQVPRFSTYDDHRMAMAFAPLALLGDIEIEDPAVVEKSYPTFWEDLQRLGFEVVRREV